MVEYEKNDCDAPDCKEYGYLPSRTGLHTFKWCKKHYVERISIVKRCFPEALK